MESGHTETTNSHILISLVTFYIKVYSHDHRTCLNYYSCVNNERQI